MATADDGLLVDEFGSIDPDEVPAPRRHRWWPAVAAAVVVAVVVALGAGLFAWQPWAGGTTPTSTTAAAGGTEELVIDLAGFALDRSVGQSPNEFGEFAQEGFVFAAPGADLENGPLLAFLVQPVENVGGVDEGDAALEINGRPATIEDSDDTIEIYWQTESGEGYGVAGSGLPRARVIAFAESVSLVDGVTVVDDPTVVDGLEPAGEVATMFAILSMVEPVFTSVDIPPQQVYTTPADGEVTLASIAAPEQFIELAALLMVDERVIDVDGTTVFIGGLTPAFAMEPDQRFLLAVRDGRLIGITAALADDELLEVLAGVRAATDDEWAAVLAAEVGPFDEAMANEGG